MKLGADKKKLGMLLGLLAVAGIVYYVNSGPSEPAASPSTSRAADPVPAAGPVETSGPKAARRTASGRANVGEFAPKPPVNVDPSKVDPTLHLELLARVESVDLEGGARNLFQFATPPPPPQPKDPPKVPGVPKIAINQPPPQPVTPVQAVAPPPPPINLKYYGFSTRRGDGEKKAFFLDGDEIIVAVEGEMIKRRYKLVKIGVNSVQMEDTATKSTQTLPLQQEAAPA